MRPCRLVIPCYNERHRLPDEQIAALVADERVGVILVDDGSTDGTAALLQQIAARHPRAAAALLLPANRGKAEAVRAGMLLGLEQGARLVGYADADFSAPAAELLRLLGVIEREQVDVLIGSRVARLGADIRRVTARHLLGRVFATFASAILQEQVYDTQCGAKWFRAGEPLRLALREPFTTSWSFDVELLGRLLGCFDDAPPITTLEHPVEAWHHVPGSKLGVRGMAVASSELLSLAARSRKLRRALRR